MASPCICFHIIVIIHKLSLTSCTHAHRFIPDTPAGCFHVNAYVKDSCQFINNRSALKMYIFDCMQTFVHILFFCRVLFFYLFIYFIFSRFFTLSPIFHWCVSIVCLFFASGHDVLAKKKSMKLLLYWKKYRVYSDRIWVIIEPI